MRLLDDTLFPGIRTRLSAIAAARLSAAAAEAALIAILIPLTTAADSTPVGRELGGFFNAAIGFWWIVVSAAAALAVRAVANYIAIRLWAGGIEHYERLHRGRLLEELLNAEWACQSREPTGRLQQLLTHHAECLTKAFTALSWSSMHAISTIVLSIAALAAAPVAALGSLVFLAVCAAAVRPLQAWSRTQASCRAAALAAYVRHIGQGLALLRELRVFGGEARFAAAAEAQADVVGRTRRHQNVVGSCLPIYYQTAAGCALVAGLAVVHAAGADGASALVGMLLIARAASSAQHCHVARHQLQEAQPFLNEAEITLREYQAARRPQGGLSVERIESIEFRRVGFAYEPNRKVLHDARFVARRGEVIGIVGPSGAGKSTLIHLLLRLLQPTAGTVLVNGSPVELFALADWYRRTALVPQEPALFHESIADCIRFGRDEIGDQRIDQAVAAAGLSADVAQMSAGLATLVGERGGALSCGQRQRVAIARALAGEPDLVVFDEPTAALDAASEETIVDTIAHLRGRALVFVITHRPALLRACDRVVEVAGGDVQEIDLTVDRDAELRVEFQHAAAQRESVEPLDRGTTRLSA